MKSCCFIGHRKIEITDILNNKLEEIILYLIEKENVTIFYFGSKSDFNSLCYKITTRLKEKYPFICRVFCSCKGEVCLLETEREKISKLTNNYSFMFYDKEIFFKNRNTAHKFGYIQGNKEIINKSDFCIFYFDKNYIPQSKQHKKQITIKTTQSGTSIAYNYAINKNKKVINLFK